MSEERRRTLAEEIGLTFLGLTLASIDEVKRLADRLVEDGRMARADAERTINELKTEGASRAEAAAQGLAEALKARFAGFCGSGESEESLASKVAALEARVAVLEVAAGFRTGDESAQARDESAQAKEDY